MLITGAAGRMGQRTRALYPGSRGIDLDDADLSRAVPGVLPSEVVIHFAGDLHEDIDAAERNILMTMNVIRACRAAETKKIIIASSMRADERLIAFPISYYGAAKAAQEAMLGAWCAEDESRIGVALRFGHFSPGSSVPVLHEALRLDEAMLAYWIGEAVAFQRPGLTTWNAIGQVRT